MTRALALALVVGSAARAAESPASKPAAPAEAVPAKKPPVREMPGEPVELLTADGWTLSGRYSPSKEEDQLTFVLLHDGKGRMQNWLFFCRKMAARGVGFLAVDMRGHGASVKAPPGKPATWRQFIVSRRENPYEGIREDIAAAAKFLEEKGVPPEAVALGGADLGGSVALKYAALHPEVAMVFVLSPGISYREVQTVNAVRAYKDRPILFVVADDDRKTVAEAAILFQFARQNAGEQNASLIQTARGHGTRMLYYNKGLMDQVLDWIDTPVKVPDVTTSTETFVGDGAAPDPAVSPDGTSLDPDPSLAD
ncbi:MAG: alpha/beta fold hydrolase [Elusimicrobia bacterium]|nr:alpha/beta fold hydrolase [Elusimicrobiota bacterium]